MQTRVMTATALARVAAADAKGGGKPPGGGGAGDVQGWLLGKVAR